MQCPKCGSTNLHQLHSGIDTLQDDGENTHPEDTFVAIDYQCPECGKITMFFDYDRTEKEYNEEIHKNPYGKTEK